MPPKLDLDLPALAKHLASKGPHKTLRTPCRIRILFAGQYIADTTSALYVWEHPYYPQYYLPASSFSQSLISKGKPILSDDGKPIATPWTVTIGSRHLEQILAFSSDLSGPAEALKGLVKVNFNSADQWFEEDTPIYVHPKDPFKRVDIVHSTRPIRIFVKGTKVAETTSSMHLYETGLPVRYYMPLTAVQQGVLKPSASRTQCPYKGEAEYYSVEVNGETVEEVVWYYTRPTVECAAVQGLVCFYNEKVEVEVDGKMEGKVQSPFS